MSGLSITCTLHHIVLYRESVRMVCEGIKWHIYRIMCASPCANKSGMHFHWVAYHPDLYHVDFDTQEAALKFADDKINVFRSAETKKNRQAVA